MNLKEQRVAELDAAQNIVDAAKAANREMTSDELKSVEEHVANL